MGRSETYLFRQAAAAFIGGLFTLTAVIWVTQALRQLDLLTTKGQTILVFLAITGLGLPFLMAVIAPVALFASVLYCLNKLNSDSELVVMGAAGVSTAKLMSPFVILFTLVFGSVAALHLEIMPNSFNAIEALTAHVHADFISNFARPGAFVELESGFVFHYREHAPDGSLRGVFIQDRRDPAKVATFISETGEIVDYGPGMRKGYYGRPDLTEEAVWVSETGRTYLRSGDLGHLDEDGFLYVSGRKKDMIKSGGINIYAVDIEEVLMEHPAVAEVAVVGVPHPRWMETPVGVVVLAPGSAIDEQTLLEWLNAKLAKYQRVSRIILRGDFPRATYGKIQKDKLREEYCELQWD